MIAPRPFVSVVLAVCNQLNSLKLTLGSLEANPLPCNHEILVLDTGDDHLTGQFLAVQAEKGAIRLLEPAPGLTRTEARNRAAVAAAGETLLFLDAGMIAGPGWADALIETMQGDVAVGAVAGKVILTDGRIDHAGLALLRWREGTHPAEQGVLLSGRSLQAARPVARVRNEQPLRVQALGGEALLVRETAFHQAHGFDPDIGCAYRTDKALAEGDPAGIDLCLRLAHRGWERIYQPHSLMTRLRSPEAALDKPEQPDPSLLRLGEVWAESVTPDFLVGGSQGIVAQRDGTIRPYVAPRLETRRQRGGDFASIIVLTHNARDYVEACLASVLAHTDARHELILVDNGSSDDTVQTLQQAAARRPGTRLILEDRNLGFAAGNNRGMAVARGRHIVLLNSDTVVTAGWVERLMAAADRNPRAGLIGPVTNRISGLQQLTTVEYDEASLAGLPRFASACARRHAGQTEQCLRLTGFCLLLKRELMARIGGLDERFGRGNYEDNDYCLRARLAGYEGLIARDCFVHHFGGASFRAAKVDYAAQLKSQWEIFRDKWRIPATVGFNEPFDPGTVLTGGFDPHRHFEPLPLPDEAETTAQEPAQTMEARS